MVKQEQVDELKAAWSRLKASLETEPATKEVHRVYDAMEKAIDSLVTDKAVKP